MGGLGTVTGVGETWQQVLDFSCQHEELTCERCGQHLDHGAITGYVLARFYSDILFSLIELVDRGGTAVGAGTVIKRVAREHAVPNAEAPLPRPSRRMRERREAS